MGGRWEQRALEAVRGADVIYTDTWTSMGQEHDADWRRVVFAGYQVDAAVRAAAGAGDVAFRRGAGRTGITVGRDDRAPLAAAAVRRALVARPGDAVALECASP